MKISALLAVMCALSGTAWAAAPAADAIEQHVSVSAKGVPVGMVLKQISESTQNALRFVVDKKAKAVKVSISAKDMPVSGVLSTLSESAGLEITPIKGKTGYYRVALKPAVSPAKP